MVSGVSGLGLAYRPLPSPPLGREAVVDVPALGAGAAFLAVARRDEVDGAREGGELPDRVLVRSVPLRVVAGQPVRRGVVLNAHQFRPALGAPRDHRLRLVTGRRLMLGDDDDGERV